MHTYTSLHFAGFSRPDAPWQNACWVAEVDLVMPLRERLAEIAAEFGQDSIALTVGRTEFVAAREEVQG